jgi:hypothetical protein
LFCQIELPKALNEFESPNRVAKSNRQIDMAKRKTRRGRTLHFGSEHSGRRGSVVAMSNNLSSRSINPPRESLTPIRRSTRLASVVLTEPQLFQSEDATAGVGVSGVGGDGGVAVK